MCEGEKNENKGEKTMLGECIKLPSLGPGPLFMMDHSPQAKHFIPLSKEITTKNKLKITEMRDKEATNKSKLLHALLQRETSCQGSERLIFLKIIYRITVYSI